MFHTRPIVRYLTNPFSYLEIFFFCVHFIFIARWYSYVFLSKRKLFDVDQQHFVSYYDTAHELFVTYQYVLEYIYCLFVHMYSFCTLLNGNMFTIVYIIFYFFSTYTYVLTLFD